MTEYDTPELIGRDLIWIENRVDLMVPRSFAVQFVARVLRREATIARRPNDRARADLIRRMVKGGATPMCNVERDRKLADAVVSTEATTPTLVFDRFHDLWRGYSDDDLAQKSIAFRRRAPEIRAKLEAQENLIRSLRKRANNRDAQTVSRHLRGLLDELKNVRLEVNTLFKNPSPIAASQLKREVAKQRFPGLYRSGLAVFFQQDELADLERRIRRCDPTAVTHPLRFMVHLQIREWRKLHEQYQNGLDRNALLRGLAGRVSIDEVLNEIKEIAIVLGTYKFPPRLDAIAEIGRTWSRKDLLACLLLCVTQTEGLLWDLAEHLNRSGKRIYVKWPKTGKLGHHYYPPIYIRGTRKYSRDPSGRPAGNNITSAKDLLKRTRLTDFVDGGIYSYFVDDFYDDRNSLAHGRIKERDLHADVIAGIFCLWAISKTAIAVVGRSRR